MWEVVPFPVQNTNQSSKWELDAHFESAIEAEEHMPVESGFQHKNWIQRNRMTPSELHKYINDYRAYIAQEIEKAA